jgi:hypothetical protein
MTPEKEIFTTEEVAQMMGCARSTIEEHAIAVPRSILENHPQRSELFRIRIPALRCFG